MREFSLDNNHTSYLFKLQKLYTIRLRLCSVRQLLLIIAIIMITACEKKETPVANIIVSPTSITIEIGETSQLNATLKDGAGNID
jgi:hypothetical protein